MRVGEFMEYMASLKGLHYDRKKLNEVIITSLEQVHLEKELHTRFGQLSGGMKRRLLFAQAVLGEPKILILDEPTAWCYVKI
jgi:ABC-type multidrug transport system ATPase subunit